MQHTTTLRHLLVSHDALFSPGPYPQDGTSKMSKSAESDGSRINLLDPPDVITSKIKRAKTDGTPSRNIQDIMYFDF
jgi:hypothetical protein